MNENEWKSGQRKAWRTIAQNHVKIKESLAHWRQNIKKWGVIQDICSVHTFWIVTLSIDVKLRRPSPVDSGQNRYCDLSIVRSARL